MKKYKLSITVFTITFILLTFVELKFEQPLLLAERFISGGGWVEILFVSCYGAFIVNKMQNPSNVPKWRKITWTTFSMVFFFQLIIGLSGYDNFLMTGKLHLPIPMMIIAGPIFRGQFSVMTILFLSTVVITGPAWCSQLCYFGAFDNLASGDKATKDTLKHKGSIKSTILILVIVMAILLRFFKVDLLISTFIAAVFGLTGILIMILYSMRRKKMVHCVMYCPVGTVVNLVKHINPFRMYIEKTCSLCMNCTKFCKYDALNPSDIKNSAPSVTCTLCGDCLSGCHKNSIKYKFINMSPENARNLWLVLTVSLHSACLALARI